MMEERTCSAIPSASTSGRTDGGQVRRRHVGRRERGETRITRSPGFGLVSHLISPPGLRKFDSLEEMIRPSNIKAKAPLPRRKRYFECGATWRVQKAKNCTTKKQLPSIAYLKSMGYLREQMHFCVRYYAERALSVHTSECERAMSL